MCLLGVIWDGVLVKSNRKSKLFVCGVDYEVCRGIELYVVSTNGLFLMADHGSEKCSNLLICISWGDLVLTEGPNKASWFTAARDILIEIDSDK